MIAETHAALLYRLGHEAAAQFAREVLRRPYGRTVWADPPLFDGALAHWIEKYPDKTFTLTDAVSFEVMRRDGIQQAFTFDRDFRRAGFGPLS